MEIFFGWFLFSLIVGVIGASRNIGFFGAFFLSLLLSPIIGIIITLVSKNKEDEKHKEIQQRTLEQIKKNTVPTKLVPNNQQNIIDQLKELEQMRDRGAITEDEYQKMKNKLVSSFD